MHKNFIMHKSVFYLCFFEKLGKTLDNDGGYPTLLTGLWKASDCRPRCLVITKLYGYGFDLPLLELINNYLTNRHQKENTEKMLQYLENQNVMKMADVWENKVLKSLDVIHIVWWKLAIIMLI